MGGGKRVGKESGEREPRKHNNKKHRGTMMINKSPP